MLYQETDHGQSTNLHKKSPLVVGKTFGGLQRGRDSNPRYSFPYTRFPGEPLQPLGHLSVTGGKSKVYWLYKFRQFEEVISPISSTVVL